MARGFGAAERSSSLRTGGDPFKAINTDKKELYEYLEGDHSRVMEWGMVKGEIEKIAKIAGVIREQYPAPKTYKDSFDNEAVDEAVKATKMFDPDENPQIDEHIAFAKGFNALDKAIEAGDFKKVGSAARDLLKAIEAQNGAEYVNEVESGNIDDPFMSEMLKGARGLINASQRGTGDIKNELSEMRDAVISNFTERGENSPADFNDMFESSFNSRFPNSWEVLRALTAKGIDVKKLV